MGAFGEAESRRKRKGWAVKFIFRFLILIENMNRNARAGKAKASWKKLGQVGVEYVLVLAVLLLILVPIIYYTSVNTRITNRSAQARVAVDALANAVDTVYSQGPGAKTKIVIYVPDGVQTDGTGIYGRELRYNLTIAEGAYADIYALARGNVTGTLPTVTGRHFVNVEMLGGTVNISE
ncbi:Uncharacterised protein [Candidatus Gugararchaeum adminiculabundum]|nr:Uncharacterised protein [Candidatus Gugararchaeum adminiculabundum]